MEPVLYMFACFLLVFIGGLAWVIRDAEGYALKATGAFLWALFVAAFLFVYAILGFSGTTTMVTFLSVTTGGFFLDNLLNLLPARFRRAPGN